MKIEILWLLALAWLVFFGIGFVLVVIYVGAMFIRHAIDIRREGGQW